MTIERSVIVAEHTISDCRPGTEPSGPALVAAAERDGFDRVVVNVRSTADGWAVVHRDLRVLYRGDEKSLSDLTLAETRDAVTADGRVATLEETMLEAHRRDIGLVIRIHDTLVVEALTGALGIMAGEGHGELRRRYLVVVPDARIGKRLRMGAQHLPSARSIRPTGGAWRAALARRFPNLARAAADADDLVLSATLATPADLRDRWVPMLARRGAYVWVEGVTPATRPDYENVGAGGLLIETPIAH
jgi:glycerophosphoryl diester phosphodiesterase